MVRGLIAVAAAALGVFAGLAAVVVEQFDQRVCRVLEVRFDVVLYLISITFELIELSEAN